MSPLIIPLKSLNIPKEITKIMFIINCKHRNPFGNYYAEEDVLCSPCVHNFYDNWQKSEFATCNFKIFELKNKITRTSRKAETQKQDERR